MVGAGWIAQEHRRVLGSMADAELAAVCDIDPERAGSLAAGTGARIYSDWRDLLDREDLGALIVCTPPRSHRDPAVAALSRGLPVYLEKPIARTLEDAADIVAAAATTGTVCAVGYQWHALDLLDELPGLLAGQQVGLLVGTNIGPTQSRPWFTDMSAGGGNLLERGSHHMDLVRAVAGAAGQARRPWCAVQCGTFWRVLTSGRRSPGGPGRGRDRCRGTSAWTCRGNTARPAGPSRPPRPRRGCGAARRRSTPPGSAR